LVTPLANPFGVRHSPPSSFVIGHSSFSPSTLSRRSPAAAGRILPLALPLALFLATSQLSLAFSTTPPLPPGPELVERQHSPAFAATSIDGIDCITADDADDAPLQVAVVDKSAGWPKNDDNGPRVSVDRANLPTRTNKASVHFATHRIEGRSVRTPDVTPIFLLRVRWFYCLHEHIRERAPPLSRRPVASQPREDGSLGVGGSSTA